MAFDSESKLKAQLKDDNGRLLKLLLERAAPAASVQTQMPPVFAEEFQKLSLDEHQEFSKYLNQLVH